MSLPSSVIIGGASKEYDRNDADFYPTPPECVFGLFNAFPSLFFGRVWEPACGDGAISTVAERIGAQVISSDLNDRGYGEAGINFLQASWDCDAIITNPPFNIADEFIRHARSFKVPFAMLLKATYWHALSRHKLFIDTGPIAVLPMLWRPNFAPERGSSPTMDVCWTVWDSEPAPSCAYSPMPRPKPEGQGAFQFPEGV